MRVLEVPARKRPIHTGLRAAFFKSQTIYSGSTLPKDKAASRRQYKQYGKASQRSILAKEAAISGFARVFEIFDDQLQVLHAVEFVDG